MAIASVQRCTARVGLLPDGSRGHRRRAARGDLRRPRCRCSRRGPGGNDAPRPGARRDRHAASPQRTPARRCRVPPRAHALPHRRRRLSRQGPQPQRQADRSTPVVPARLDPARHHRDHRAAADAQVAAAGDHRCRRRGGQLERTADLAVTYAVPVQPEPPAVRATGCSAPRTAARPRLLDRGRSLQPDLDLERAVDDDGEVLGRGHTRRDPGHDAEGVGAPSASPIWRARCPVPRTRPPSSSPIRAGANFLPDGTAACGPSRSPLAHPAAGIRRPAP